MKRRHYVIHSNADLEQTHSRLWKDPELRAVDVTRRGKLELKPVDMEAQIFLTSKGTIEVFCRRKAFKKMFALLKRKLVSRGQKLELVLAKNPVTYSLSFDFIDLPLYIGLINAIIGIILYCVQLFFGLSEMIMCAILIPLLVISLVVHHRWRTTFPE